MYGPVRTRDEVPALCSTLPAPMVLPPESRAPTLGSAKGRAETGMLIRWRRAARAAAAAYRNDRHNNDPTAPTS